jgi:hypothetical protein
MRDPIDRFVMRIYLAMWVVVLAAGLVSLLGY